MTKGEDSDCPYYSPACLVDKDTDYAFLESSATLDAGTCTGTLGGMWVSH